MIAFGSLPVTHFCASRLAALTKAARDPYIRGT
jgi:hypothetical protein